MERKFFRTVVEVEVLSEDVTAEGYSLETIAGEIQLGDWSGRVTFKSAEALTSKQAAEALQAQGSDPEFFSLDREGNDI